YISVKEKLVRFSFLFYFEIYRKRKAKECPVTHCKQCRGLPTAKTCFSYEKLKPKPKTKIGVHME
ncbi:hypothetical protein, partial [Klebsiella pneumoniae]|uniref:hypothetical protein n=3 Tax=Klebsiella pneumoniae TaxID=573 RepID=UPI0019679BEE